MPKFNNRSYVPKNFKGLPERAKLVFEGVIFDTYQWEELGFDDKTKLKFEKLKRPDSVRIIALLDDNKILINKEEQAGTGIFYDVPAGKHDEPKETEEEAAKRELLEETGYKFMNWIMVQAYQPIGKIDWICYTFVAWGEQSKSDTHLEVGEKIESMHLTLDEVKELLGTAKNVRMPSREQSLLFNANSVEDLKYLPDLRDEQA